MAATEGKRLSGRRESERRGGTLRVLPRRAFSRYDVGCFDHATRRTLMQEIGDRRNPPASNF